MKCHPIISLLVKKTLEYFIEDWMQLVMGLTLEFISNLPNLSQPSQETYFEMQRQIWSYFIEIYTIWSTFHELVNNFLSITIFQDPQGGPAVK